MYFPAAAKVNYIGRNIENKAKSEDKAKKEVEAKKEKPSINLFVIPREVHYQEPYLPTYDRYLFTTFGNMR